MITEIGHQKAINNYTVQAVVEPIVQPGCNPLCHECVDLKYTQSFFLQPNRLPPLHPEELTTSCTP